MNQQVKQELKMKLRNIAKLIIAIILLSSVIIVIFKFFGQCIGVLAGAVIVTLFVAYSLLDKEYRNEAMESSVGIYAILGYILLIIVLWLLAYGICVEFCQDIFNDFQPYSVLCGIAFGLACIETGPGAGICAAAGAALCGFCIQSRNLLS